MPESILQINSCLFIVNPGASNYSRGRDYGAQLAAHYGKEHVTTYKLTDTDFKKPELLQAELKKLTTTSLLAIHGGDGTVNWVINQLLALKAVTPRKATVLPLWGGNACDLANMVNGRQVDDITPLLSNAQATPVYPLHYNLTNDQDKTVIDRYAMCYLSFGAIAHTAEELDKSKLVARVSSVAPLRFVAEMLVSIISLYKARKFKIADESGTQSVYDLLFVNGSRLAKVYPTPGKLERPSFVVVQVQRKHPVVLGYLAHLSQAWLEARSRGRTVETRDFLLKSKAWMQFDGEVTRVKAGTTVTIAPAKKTLSVLSTILRQDS